MSNLDKDEDRAVEMRDASDAASARRGTMLETRRIVNLLAATYGFNRTEAMNLLSEQRVTEDARRAEREAKQAAKRVAADARRANREAKRAATGRTLFSHEYLPEVKKLLTRELKEGEKLKLTDINKELAAQWNFLSDEDRAEWNAKADDINAAINPNPAKGGMATRKKKYRRRYKKTNKMSHLKNVQHIS